METRALAFQGTIAFSLRVVWRTGVFSLPFSFALGCILALDLSRFLGLALRLSRTCLPMPLGKFCHAGGWHLRRKPCVELLYVSFLLVTSSHLGSVFSLRGYHTALA